MIELPPIMSPGTAGRPHAHQPSCAHCSAAFTRLPLPCAAAAPGHPPASFPHAQAPPRHPPEPLKSPPVNLCIYTPEPRQPPGQLRMRAACMPTRQRTDQRRGWEGQVGSRRACGPGTSDQNRDSAAASVVSARQAPKRICVAPPPYVDCSPAPLEQAPARAPARPPARSQPPRAGRPRRHRRTAPPPAGWRARVRAPRAALGLPAGWRWPPAGPGAASLRQPTQPPARAPAPPSARCPGSARWPAPARARHGHASTRPLFENARAQQMKGVGGAQLVQVTAHSAPTAPMATCR